MTVLINAYCTVVQLPEPRFPHHLNARRDRSDPELLEHLGGLMGYVMKDGREMDQTRYAVLGHVRRVVHHLSFETDEQHLDAMSAWAVEANAILFLPSGAVADPFGRTLVDPADGSAGADAAMPYPGDAIERKARSDQWLQGHQIPVAAFLPPTLGAAETSLRPPQEVARRMMSLTLVAIRAESVNNGEPIPVEEMRDRFPAVFDSLTPAERSFIENQRPDQQDLIDHAWKYEAADTLRWALGRSEELAPATGICDVPATAGDLVHNGPDAILEAVSLRPVEQILDQADLHLRLHWAIRQAGVDGVEPPAGLLPGVVQERRHALNWLMRFEGADWDDVTTPT